MGCRWGRGEDLARRVTAPGTRRLGGLGAKLPRRRRLGLSRVPERHQMCGRGKPLQGTLVTDLSTAFWVILL